MLTALTNQLKKENDMLKSKSPSNDVEISLLTRQMQEQKQLYEDLLRNSINYV